MNEAAVEWLERVRDAERRGDHLKAHDLAMQGLREHGDSIALKHRAVLSLARCGSTEGAERLLRELGLAGHSDEDARAATRGAPSLARPPRCTRRCTHEPADITQASTRQR
jgi:hypothetical protein